MGVADEGKRDGRCKGMGDVRDGKVLRDTDSWEKRKATNARGRAQRGPTGKINTFLKVFATSTFIFYRRSPALLS